MNNKPDSKLPEPASTGQAQPEAASQGDGIASAHKATGARANGDGALFEVLGHHGQRFYFRTAALGVVSFGADQLSRIGSAMMLVQDIEHWRAGYALPGRGHKVDWARVGADLMRLAIEAGPYEPAAHERPRVKKRLVAASGASAAA